LSWLFDGWQPGRSRVAINNTMIVFIMKQN